MDAFAAAINKSSEGQLFLIDGYKWGSTEPNEEDAGSQVLVRVRACTSTPGEESSVKYTKSCVKVKERGHDVGWKRSSASAATAGLVLVRVGL